MPLTRRDLVCSRTQFIKLNPNAVNGGQVYSIGPLNIAYRDGDQSTVYIKFRSQDESESPAITLLCNFFLIPTTEDRFKADYFDMWRYVEQAAN